MENKNNTVIDKDWGYELVWADVDGYCGKILVFERANKKTSLHFHKNTSKTWFVNAGKLRVQWIDTADGKAYAKELSEGSTFYVPALMPVQLESLSDNSAMAEVANSNDPDDFYKLS